MAAPARLQGAAVVTALLAALAPPASATRSWAGDTGVVTVSGDAGYAEGEEPLTVNPKNPDELLTVANVFQPFTGGPAGGVVGGGGVQDTRLYVTRDGGRSWRTYKLDQGGLGPVTPPGGAGPAFSDALNAVSTDADVAWDRRGNAYFQAGNIHGARHGFEEVATVWRSTDSGRTWGPGSTAVNATQERNELDRPWLAVDNSGGRRDGRLYITFTTTAFLYVPPEVFVKHSDDHGATWSPSVRVDDGIYETQWNPRARPVVGAAGALHVVYDRGPVGATPFTPYDGPLDLVLATSTDGGATFTRTVVDDDVRRVTSPDEATPAYTEMIAALAADPRRPGRVAVAWPQAESSTVSRVVLRYSNDGGIHWSRRIDVSDAPRRTPNQHDHVTLSWLDDGRLFVGWRDRRCCGGSWADDHQQWVRPVRPDGRGGLRLGRVVEFTQGPQSPTASGRGALQPDEFQGLVATRKGVALTWTQLGEEGLARLRYRRIPLQAFTA